MSIPTLKRIVLLTGLAIAFAAGIFGSRIRPALLSGLDPNAIAQTDDALAAPTAPKARRYVDLADAAESAGASVVSIGVERTTYRMSGYMDDGMFPFFDMRPVYEKQQEKMPFLGSGIALDAKGHIATNYHVVEDANRVFVTLSNKKEYPARILDSDPILDIAILKIDAPDIKPARLGNSDQVRLGEWVLAIGNPYGAMLADPTPTITAGVVSALNRYFTSAGDKPRLYEGMIQTDASINPGNSGGALVNADGDVIGVNTFIFSSGGGSVGIGFAIPINRVKWVLEEIEQYGKIRRAQMDLDVRDITPYVQRALNLNAAQGILVYKVAVNGPAMESGIQPGDVIRSVNGRPVNSRNDFLVHISGKRVGESVKIACERAGKPYETQYKVQGQETVK